MRELWWHDECLKRIIVKWLDNSSGLKWIEGQETGHGTCITLDELTSSGWQQVMNPEKDGIYPRRVVS